MNLKSIFIILSLGILLGFTQITTSINKTKDGSEFRVQINDSTEITIKQAISIETQQPVFYYSELNVPACNTGECKLIELTMYWDIFGNYYKYKVPHLSPLTKADHKKFKKKDYIRLHQILNDLNSKLKDIEFNDLTEIQAADKFKTDGISGATIKLFFDNTRIKGAVKTTHTLWHIAHGKAQNRIVEETHNFFKDSPTIFKISPTISKFKTYNFTQTQYAIKEFKDQKLDKELFNSHFKKLSKGNSDSFEKTILLSNFCLRNELSLCKSKKILKKISFK